MKRTILFVIILILLLSFAGCGSGKGYSSAFSSDVNNSETVADNSGEQQENSEVPVSEKKEWNGKINENGWLKLDLGGRKILPCQYFISSVTNTEEGQVSSDGVPLGDVLPEVYEDLPTVARGFSMDVYEWGSIRQIAVYNTDFKKIVANTNEYQLLDIIKEHEEELIVDVHIYAAGCEIFEVGWSGTELGYAFRVLSADIEASAGQNGNEPFLRLYSRGVEIPTKEYLYYSASAYYEDGVPVGMLCADGEAFFYQYYVSEIYDELSECDVSREDGLDIRLADGAEIRQIRIFDPANGFKWIPADDLAELDSILADPDDEQAEYVVEIVVYRQGNYIEELDEYEYEANGYAFIVKLSSYGPADDK